MEEMLRNLKMAPPLYGQEGCDLIRAAERAYECWNAIPRLPLPPKLKDEINYQPKTEFGRRLLEIRSRIVASGIPMLGWDEIEQEVAARREREDLQE
jgi:hypothetical protein